VTYRPLGEVPHRWGKTEELRCGDTARRCERCGCLSSWEMAQLSCPISRTNDPGHVRVPTGRHGRQPSEETLRIRALLAEGKPRSEVAAELGVTLERVSSVEREDRRMRARAREAARNEEARSAPTLGLPTGPEQEAR
jgi:hypothetical protein